MSKGNICEQSRMKMKGGKDIQDIARQIDKEDEIKRCKTKEEAERYFEEYIREHNKKYGVKAVLE